MSEYHSESIFEGRMGAVSLTFDDGTVNQLANAIPPLDERGLQGTFYVNPRDRVMNEFGDQWRNVASRGHEIGNHTYSHPCPAAITGGRGLEDMTIEEVEADIAAAQSRLMQIAPQQNDWSFAYPCYSTYVGRGERRRSYVPIVARHFLAARAGGEYGFANAPSLLDLAALVGTPVERIPGPEIVSLIEKLTAEGKWVILVYHDIEGQVLSVRNSDYLPVLDFLAANRHNILTAPVIEIARLVASVRFNPQDTV